MAVKKQWYDIVTPKAFGEVVVGETLAADPKFLLGRTLNVSFAELSNDFGKYYIKAIFQIEATEGQKAKTKFIGHECMRERLYRMVQRGSKKVEAIQDVETKDGMPIRVKSIIILRSNAGTSVKNAARNAMKETVIAVAKETEAEKFIGMMLAGELQAKLRQECKKITPVINVEIRKSEVLGQRKIIEGEEHKALLVAQAKEQAEQAEAQ
ncbi:MAG: hypothetical protein HY364_03765 [Candidatus Aenigmarchaeota archaeon]|nr:hypothetical protein [Candidatus Aenigmarchaeota archaeon]